ncbi:Bestrophin, RFP-TM, chloride channel-domain-containing protein [Kockovaella imperatae]|uniref:Bestrophin, RFP-TM, chloride channel-domain-containing protein n=1 Tax=Kockovaella imperatae TaxID=4999 RepID=A0A1Y1UB28_9TREE|nr:Bestrophin, RFP-TM, chloride channel-domain-containing protein [Kockovaella imperatae]ORX35212.1 Bestrophin, RFP-TM, chloride channel-domain-containing protein [Kockovaella imperatae]
MSSNEKISAGFQPSRPVTNRQDRGSTVVIMESFKQSLAWTAYKFTSTVLDEIWPQALLFTGIATMVTCISEFTSVQLQCNSITLTVLGVVVSLVVSFHTNNSYLKWWEGRNVWTNITSVSRQLAMLIWLQLPNNMKKKKEDGKEKDKGKGNDEKSKDKFEPPRAHEDDDDSDSKHSPEHRTKAVAEKEMEEQRSQIEGILIKKSYIGLIHAFSVAMKHSLRGEKGPFYSDLYNLIAWLPKYNPSAYPPITRDHLLVLWQNGIPRQKWHRADDVAAVPLSQQAAFDGYTFDIMPGADMPNPGPTDHEANPGGLTTRSEKFKSQAVNEAKKYVQDGQAKIMGFCHLDQKHRIRRGDTPVRLSQDDTIIITTVELMPPRHPPPATVWDFVPPLRIFKIVFDWFKTQKRLEQQERTRGGKRRRSAVKSEIAQEMLLYLHAFAADMVDMSVGNSFFTSQFMTGINELQKAISDLDKIATTPLPSAYRSQLRLTVWAYLFFLPVQLYQYLHWVTIPAVAIASVIYLGFLEIGSQIEMPFGYEQSDLDLDKFCANIGRQLAEVTAFPTRVPTKKIVRSHLNQPLLPSLSLSMPDLLGVPEVDPKPTSRGFNDSYQPRLDEQDKSDRTQMSQTHETTPPKSISEVEAALNANWRDVENAWQEFKSRKRHQLENKTGMEVAVLALRD